jgi:hypothetical protein
MELPNQQGFVRQSPSESRVEGLDGQSLAEPSHCTRNCDFGQTPNRRAVLIVRLMGMNLDQKGRAWQLAKALVSRLRPREVKDQLAE